MAGFNLQEWHRWGGKVLCSAHMRDVYGIADPLERCGCCIPHDGLLLPLGRLFFICAAESVQSLNIEFRGERYRTLERFLRRFPVRSESAIPPASASWFSESASLMGFESADLRTDRRTIRQRCQDK